MEVTKQERAQECNTPTTLKWVKGHSGLEGNDKADALAKLGSEKTEQDEVDLLIPPSLCLTGAKLNCMTQARAYKAIRQIKMSKNQYQRAMDRRSTKVNTGRAKRYKIGDYWQNITNFEHRANCHPCGVTESMDHILSECQCPGQQQIWELTKEICAKKGLEWNEPSLGTILGAGRRSDGDARFLRIITSKSTHLIWKLRCERVVKGQDAPSPEEVARRWKKSVEARLELDHLMITTQFQRRSLSKGLVERTWENVISDKDNLPENWTGGACYELTLFPFIVPLLVL
ncbi:hypothetical protein F5050DRAFT_1802253 [Lentinula boryana]|uniref:RNase H type-1 domain-containing protein n=1 Tax=Lentinula boryana TaxID=40481 RepID=A0ABQ8PX37_9AGAR|nr:hypothetical protein F5050DRAFT_1802253 [Lentinula boryana]